MKTAIAILFCLLVVFGTALAEEKAPAFTITQAVTFTITQGTLPAPTPAPAAQIFDSHQVGSDTCGTKGNMPRARDSLPSANAAPPRKTVIVGNGSGRGRR